MSNLLALPCYDEDGALNVVVEAPRGASIKLKYEPSLEAFTVSRGLPIGLTYPFDWGFIPGTLAEDGDPLDALVLSDAPSWPGVVARVRALGVLRIEQDGEKGRERNDRLITLLEDLDRWGDLSDVRKLPKPMRDQIEKFFLDTTFFTDKNARSRGWAGPAAARRLIRQSVKAFEKGS